VRRVLVLVGILAVLASSCADRGDFADGLSARLQNQVASIRQAAEAERPGIAISRLNTLIDLVSTGLDAGSIDQARAVEILEAARDVESQLVLLPTPSPEPSPPPIEEDEGGNGGKGKGNGKGKDKGDGNGGHGNDD
jgi:hypothetical protein